MNKKLLSTLLILSSLAVSGCGGKNDSSSKKESSSSRVSTVVSSSEEASSTVSSSSTTSEVSSSEEASSTVSSSSTTVDSSTSSSSSTPVVIDATVSEILEVGASLEELATTYDYYRTTVSVASIKNANGFYVSDASTESLLEIYRFADGVEYTPHVKDLVTLTGRVQRYYNNVIEMVYVDVDLVSAAEYTVTISECEHGSVTASATSGAYGSEITLTATPDAGYKLEYFYVDGSQVSSTTNEIVITLSGDVTAYATFVEESTTVAQVETRTYDFSDYESMSAKGDKTYELDSDVSMSLVESALWSDGTLRIYGGKNVSFASKLPVKSFQVNAGYKDNNLDVYVSEDGVTYGETYDFSITTTAAYADHTITFAAPVKYFKLVVRETIQVRLNSISLTLELPQAETPSLDGFEGTYKFDAFGGETVVSLDGEGNATVGSNSPVPYSWEEDSFFGGFVVSVESPAYDYLYLYFTDAKEPNYAAYGYDYEDYYPTYFVRA